MGARLLFVCTGNVCRSPIAQHLLAARLEHPAWLEIASAGTHAPTGHAMAGEAAILAREYGAREVDGDRHRARAMVPALVEQADLVVTMTRAHRRGAVEAAPRRLRQTFTLREFARVACSIDAQELARVADAAADASPEERLRALVALVGERRPQTPAPADPDDDDIVDPFGEDDAVYRRCADQLLPALDHVERILRVAAATTPPLAPERRATRAQRRLARDRARGAE
ncbi:low molecular weight phosphatase family protein [Microbacterium sp. LRZ72]|uniref:arsenate reductase/protein-tyrosine-phosphatase family protein n=1 Tax=Microbacterium sp. LRZ72 TaxID=2942481 RepID=UPI0029A24678|nr:low molecular weight phosphatase family protein [Microbacterium sp. LRZ72]MDX2376582.1 low molecular weight phosphatase family protein [Microbacterium sp. LRZ72]